VRVLHAAAEAGARGPAGWVAAVVAGEIRRRIVAHAPPPRPQPARADANPANAAASDRVLHEPHRRAQFAIANIAPSDATAAIEHLLRQSRKHAGPVVLAATAGSATFPAAVDTTAAAPGRLTLIERLDDDLPSVWLYGAGHVGQALARILMELPLRLTWIDSRAGSFPKTLPDGVRVLHDDDSVATVSEAPVGAFFVVMSHSHPLDFELCHALLERNDFAWLGLIGSDSKAARFRSRLARTGLGADVIAKLVCPIGVEGIRSKWPSAIAVAVAAQLMQKISAATERPEVLPSVAMPQLGAEPLLPASPATATSLGPPCAPELCVTCGSSSTAAATRATPGAPGHAAGPTNSTAPRPDTVTS